MRRVSVFGSTGSIGQTTLQIIQNDAEAFEIDVLSGHRNLDLLAAQTQQFKPKTVALADAATADKFSRILGGNTTNILVGKEGLREAASQDVDVMVSGIVGFAGLEVSLLGAEHADILALANKESLVCAGPILKAKCAEHQTKLIPVDSEHSAIFQCLRGEDAGAVDRIILTASGGPFLHKTTDQMRDVTPQMAANHPNWDMGQRISIDSASLFNKAMEVIEAKELFDLTPSQIEVLVHPQSIVHSMVGYVDRSIMAQMGPPDMTGAIGFALNYPERKPLNQDRLDFTTLNRLDFQPLDNARFPAVGLAHKAMEIGGLAGAVFNAAKEKSLDRFIANQIGFLEMADFVANALKNYTILSHDLDITIESVIEIDSRTRQFVDSLPASGALNV